MVDDERNDSFDPTQIRPNSMRFPFGDDSTPQEYPTAPATPTDYSSAPADYYARRPELPMPAPDPGRLPLGYAPPPPGPPAGGRTNKWIVGALVAIAVIAIGGIVALVPFLRTASNQPTTAANSLVTAYTTVYPSAAPTTTMTTTVTPAYTPPPMYTTTTAYPTPTATTTTPLADPIADIIRGGYVGECLDKTNNGATITSLQIVACDSGAANFVVTGRTTDSGNCGANWIRTAYNTGNPDPVVLCLAAK